jgi:hypothetical protein
MIPSTGQIHEENAALTRDESKIQSRKYANLGPMKAIDRARQHIGQGILLIRRARVNTRGRASVFGLALAALVLAGAGTAAGRPQWIWAKSWAEEQLLKKFPGTTPACAPVGPPSRKQGYNAYAEFACTVALTNSSYTLVIRPRSKAAWTTLRIRKTTVSTPSSGTTGTTTMQSSSSSSGVDVSHRLAEMSLDGSRLTLDDGSSWLVSPVGEYATVLWSIGDTVGVLRGTAPGYPYQLYDTQNGTVAPAKSLTR